MKYLKKKLVKTCTSNRNSIILKPWMDVLTQNKPRFTMASTPEFSPDLMTTMLNGITQQDGIGSVWIIKHRHHKAGFATYFF